MSLQIAIQKILSCNALDKLDISLVASNIDDEGFRSLAQALGSSRADYELLLDLALSNVSPENVTHLANALQSGNTPRKLTLDLARNKIGNTGVLYLANALQSSKAPNDLTLNLEHNFIDDIGVEHITRALQSGNVPHRLTIKIKWNPHISQSGYQGLARALAYQNKFNCKQITIEGIPPNISQEAFNELEQSTFALASVALDATNQGSTLKGLPSNLIPVIMFFAQTDGETKFNQPTRMKGKTSQDHDAGDKQEVDPPPTSYNT